MGVCVKIYIWNHPKGKTHWLRMQFLLGQTLNHTRLSPQLEESSLRRTPSHPLKRDFNEDTVKIPDLDDKHGRPNVSTCECGVWIISLQVRPALSR